MRSVGRIFAGRATPKAVVPDYERLIGVAFMSEPTVPAPDVDIAGAAAELNTSAKFIRRRIADGTLPAYRIKGSRFIRILRADLEALKQPIGENQ